MNDACEEKKAFSLGGEQPTDCDNKKIIKLTHLIEKKKWKLCAIVCWDEMQNQ